MDLNSIDSAGSTSSRLTCWRGRLQIVLEMVGLGVSIGYVPLDLVPEDEMRDALEKELHPLHTLSKNGFQ